MGGDTIPVSHSSSAEDLPPLEKDFHPQSLDSYSTLSDDTLITKADKGSLDGGLGLVPGEFQDMGLKNSSSSVVLEANRRRKEGIYMEVWQSYEELQCRRGSLEDMKMKILSYTPGSWMEKIAGVKLDDFRVPEITSLLLIGPKGSGKSSLINKVSRMFENNKFQPERAQVSYNPSGGEGTYFLQEYAIPRGSTSFCLYDTRSLPDDVTESTKMFKRWMTEGVRNGELVKRGSDCSTLKTTMKYKARHYSNLSGKVRMVNYVIMVVNGLSVLESMDSADERKKLYTQMIAAQFNSPFLSFRDDKPVVVVTHGDLLELSDRVRVRVCLGELLGIPPTTQIFDIAGSNESENELSIADLLCYCLDRADKNTPLKSRRLSKLHAGYTSRDPSSAVPSHTAFVADAPEGGMDAPIDWQAIRHLWLGTD
ncbi:OLC1v1006709C1 [Oldenlandia corymbosa var. corymbosa]|uniref:OLC1v1006709C1 n=1 Tax=Oldenlandia corymbosa var. corymbosa TaxID=529605 RepID=A0AAV1DJ51_OLDCO|nr:OLC1v1006709C1 [Oldenlandia corymbosa var. corymbosa]